MGTRQTSARAGRRRFGRSVSGAALAGVLILASAAALAAHDFWVVPNAFAVAAGGTIEVRGQTSTKFPTSLSAVTPERVADARVVGAAGEDRITDLSVSDKSLVLRHRPSTAGQRIVAVALVPRASRTTPASLKRYIALEGNAELAERYEREGMYPKADSLTQRSVKFAKTVVEVGRGGPRAFSRAVGHALEFVPVTDPAALRAGDSLAVRLLYRGTPVAGAHLHAGVAPAAGAATAAAAPQVSGAEANEHKDLSVVTGADGIAKVPLDRSGLWNVRTLHAAPVPGGAAEWDVTFATLVFNVDRGGSAGSRSAAAAAARSGAPDGALAGAARAAPSDSADVTAVVARYHAALAAGDSAAALALLAPDAVVLESGGVETRDEYRSHHLPADIGFARAVPSTRGALRVVVRGDVAWATSTSTTQGQYQGRAINSAGAELMVLAREAAGWRIRAIHWSSRTRRPQGG
ncbi:MAG: DUF4198 domain-containing protein [Gemmatimonadaceae bacterium]